MKPRRKSLSLEADRQPNRRWSVEHNEALRELLDHLAEELALEYVRLMRAAKRKEGEPK